MDSFDYGVAAITLVIALLGLVLVYFTLRSFVKIWESRGLNSGWKLVFIRGIAFLLAAGVIVTVHFWLFNPHDGPDSVSYNPAGILGGLSLIIVGVVLTYVILPFHRKKVNKTEWPWPRRHKITMLLCVIAAVGIGVAVYQQLALRQNREAFTQARAAIDTVYADIVRQVGQPDNSRRTNDCSRPSQEFEQGPLSCHIDVSFIYGVDDRSQANNFLANIQLIIEQNRVFKLMAPQQHSLSSSAIAGLTMYGAEDDYTVNDLKCVANYTYDTPTETKLSLINKGKQPLEITIGCYGLARAQYYPLNQ